MSTSFLVPPPTWPAVCRTGFVGQDPGYAALHDMALLRAMSGLFAGSSHAYALIEDEDIAPHRSSLLRR